MGFCHSRVEFHRVNTVGENSRSYWRLILLQISKKPIKCQEAKQYNAGLKEVVPGGNVTTPAWRKFGEVMPKVQENHTGWRLLPIPYLASHNTCATSQTSRFILSGYIFVLNLSCLGLHKFVNKYYYLHRVFLTGRPSSTAVAQAGLQRRKSSSW